MSDHKYLGQYIEIDHDGYDNDRITLTPPVDLAGRKLAGYVMRAKKRFVSSSEDMYDLRFYLRYEGEEETSATREELLEILTALETRLPLGDEDDYTPQPSKLLRTLSDTPLDLPGEQFRQLRFDIQQLFCVACRPCSLLSDIENREPPTPIPMPV